MNGDLSRFNLTVDTGTFANRQIPAFDVAADRTADVDIAITDKIASDLQVLTDD